MRRSLSITFLFALTACRHGGIKPDTDGQPDTDADTDSDTDADTDPCVVQLPADTLVASRPETWMTDGGHVWVCAGVSGTAIGNGMGLYMEPESLVTATGNGIEAWAKNGASLTVAGNGATITLEPGADVQITGSGGSTVECEQVSFDTSLLHQVCP
jgi:hypothetical protein